MMRELGVRETRLLGFIVLFGEENRDWIYYKADPDWWTLRLWTRRN